MLYELTFPHGGSKVVRPKLAAKAKNMAKRGIVGPIEIRKSHMARNIVIAKMLTVGANKTGSPANQHGVKNITRTVERIQKRGKVDGVNDESMMTLFAPGYDDFLTANRD